MYVLIDLGSLDCEAMTLTDSEEDFWFVIVTIQATEVLFDSLKGSTFESFSDFEKC